jgi:excisionase family DNA binding protein
MPEADELLTVAEVATMLKLNQQTIRNYIDRNELPCVRVGRRVRIKRPDLDQLIQAGYKRLRGFAGLVDDGRILLTGWAASGAGAPAPATFVQ